MSVKHQAPAQVQASAAVADVKAPGSAVTQARTTRRRASLAQTPAAAQPAEAAAAPRTAASTRGARRKSVSPAIDAAPQQVRWQCLLQCAPSLQSS